MEREYYYLNQPKKTDFVRVTAKPKKQINKIIFNRSTKNRQK